MNIHASMIKRILAGLGIMTLLALVFIKARPLDPGRHESVLAELDEIAELNIVLDTTVLKLRHGLIYSYDPLVSALAEIRRHKANLERGNSAVTYVGDPGVAMAMREFGERLETKEALVERFKTRNAILRNSFMYLQTAVDDASRNPLHPAELRREEEALLRQVMRLNLVPGEEQYAAVGACLDQLAGYEGKLPVSANRELRQILLHARIYVESQREMEGLLVAITVDPQAVLVKDLATSYSGAFNRVLTQANVYRFLLILLAIGSVAYAAVSFLNVRDQYLRRRESEEKFRATFDQAPVGIVHTDRQGRFLAANRKYREIVGYTEEELRGMTFGDLMDAGDSASGVQPDTGRAQTAPATGPLVKRHLRKDGSAVWVSLTSSVVRESDGSPRYQVAVAEDISERTALEEDRSRQLDIIENASDFIGTMELDGRLKHINRAGRRILGMGDNADLSAQRLTDRQPGWAREIVLNEGIPTALRDGVWVGEAAFNGADGREKLVSQAIIAHHDKEGKPTYLSTIARDVTERKAAEEHLRYLAHFDVLTGLPNRVLFVDRLTQAMALAKRNNRAAGLLFIDLDRFKTVNDTLGHNVGDALLKRAAERIAACVRLTDTVGRLGGDEFAVILTELASPDDAGLVAEKIMSALSEPFYLDDHEMFASASVGIALYPNDGADPDTVIKNADTAMYRAKDLGRGNFQFYTAEMNARSLEKLNMENELRRALERGEFCLHYQPKFDLTENRINGLEALLRWQRPGRGLVPPSEFIPILEDTGLILQVGEWVVHEACRQISAWRGRGIEGIAVAINLSPRQFRQAGLVKRIKDIIATHGVDPALVEFEITESSLAADAEGAARILRELKSLGCTIAIDDFGTGYASLSYLKRFPVDTLKIDRSFIRDLCSDPNDAAITRAVIGMAHNLDLGVVAEGVESRSQLEFLRMHACDQAQGYYFSRPVPADEVTAMLKNCEDRAGARRRQRNRISLCLATQASGTTL